MGKATKDNKVQSTTYGDRSPAFSAGRDMMVHPGAERSETEHSTEHAEHRILFVAANPRDRDRLRGDEEAREIENALRSMDHGRRFDLETIWATRAADLRTALLRHQPTILHFSGHGLRGAILLEETRQRSRKIPVDRLGRLLSQFQESLRCVVLSCCESLSKAEDLTEHVEWVIGTPGKLADGLAIQFGIAFYQALAARESWGIREAFDFARASLDFEGHGFDDEQLPQLFTRRE